MTNITHLDTTHIATIRWESKFSSGTPSELKKQAFDKAMKEVKHQGLSEGEYEIADDSCETCGAFVLRSLTSGDA